MTHNLVEHSPDEETSMSTWFTGRLCWSSTYPEKITNALIGQEIPEEIGLLEIVIQILDGISDEELEAVFRDLIECVQNIIDVNGDYIS
jgi:hypothetical protein